MGDGLRQPAAVSHCREVGDGCGTQFFPGFFLLVETLNILRNLKNIDDTKRLNIIIIIIHILAGNSLVLNCARVIPASVIAQEWCPPAVPLE